MFKRSIRRGVSMLLCVGLCLQPSWLPQSMAQTAVSKIAPNMMIIFGNSFSMNRELDDKTYPPISSFPTFADDGNSMLNPTGTYNPYPAYGDSPLSKLYIAKQALSSVLQSAAANNINFGFATFRTAFGLMASSARVSTNTTWATIDPVNASIYNATTAKKQSYGNTASNFLDVQWPWVWNSVTNYNSVIGGNGKTGKAYNTQGVASGFYNDYKTGVYADSQMQFLPSGIPTQIVENTTSVGCTLLSGAYGKPNWCPNPLPATAPTADQWYTNGNLWNAVYTYKTNAIFNGAAATGSPNAGALPPLVHQLCTTLYDSQGNIFQGVYIANRVFPEAYAGPTTGNTLYTVDLDSVPYNASGVIPASSFNLDCNAGGPLGGKTATSTTGYTLVSNTYQQPWKGTTTAYATQVPAFWSGTDSAVGAAYGGIFDGWSGETTINANGQVTASYPSGVAAHEAYLLQKAGYELTQANHMGVFLDLPNPQLGYLDQRATIEGFMGLTQMSPSGMDYNPATQTIADGRGIAASTDAYNPNQEPIYDSLTDAYAYFKSYIAQDPYANCRSNNILLFYDGKEDAHTDANGNFLNPATVAAQLYSQLGVKTYVVILSSSPGDIASANAIAAAGGTGQAYQASDAASLTKSFQTVFTSVQNQTTLSAPILPLQLQQGGLVYQITSQAAPAAGFVQAFTVNANGQISSSPTWDASATTSTMMAPSNRAKRLYATGSNGVALLSSLTNDPLLTNITVSNPCINSAQTIIDYTIDPNYTQTISSNGSSLNCTYLGNRMAGKELDAFSLNDDAHLLNPPNNPSLLQQPGYIAFAQSEKNRPAALLFTNDDGFLYSVNAQTGALNWGWMPQVFLPQLQNNPSFPAQDNMAGAFTIVDVRNASSGTWSTMIIGSAEGGAYWYGLQLDANANPQADVSVGSMPAGATYPQRQAPVVTTLGQQQVAAWIVNVPASNGKTTSWLYEWNLSTGSVSSAALSVSVTSNLALDPQSGSLYFGDASGNVWVTSFSGSASTDATNVAQVSSAGTYGATPIDNLTLTTDPVNGATDIIATGNTTDALGNVYGTITVFGMGSNGYGPLWAANTQGGYVYNGSAWSPSPNVAPMLPSSVTGIAQVSDAPAVVNDTIILPVYVPTPPTAQTCGFGSGFEDLYDLRTGVLAQGRFRNAQGNLINQDVYVGAGPAYTPNVGVTSTALSVFSGSQDTLIPNQPISAVNTALDKIIEWRVH